MAGSAVAGSPAAGTPRRAAAPHALRQMTNGTVGTNEWIFTIYRSWMICDAVFCYTVKTLPLLPASKQSTDSFTANAKPLLRL